MRPEFFHEPNLYFGGNKSCVHAQVGLLAFGPHSGAGGLKGHLNIRAGAIGTQAALGQLATFLGRLGMRIQGESNDETDYDEIDFPGLDEAGPLKFTIKIEPDWTMEIRPSLRAALEAEPSWQKRVVALMETYEAHLAALTEIHPKPDITFLPLDAAHLELCKNPNFKIDKIRLEARRFDNPNAESARFFDFHNRIKAVSANLQLKTQLVRPATMKWAMGTQDPSIIAWNFSVGVYYKATGIPWKLADLDDTTCYIGLGFYEDFRGSDGNMSAAVAQVYMRTGESQVIRGQPFEWDRRRDGRDIFLDGDQMRKLIGDAIDLYGQQRKNQRPTRIVVHKPGPFNENEIDAIRHNAASGTAVDAVHIRNHTVFRSYYRGFEYPMVRGTAFLGSREGFLFTTGFTPAMNTYKGAAVPEPIQFTAFHLESDATTLCRDLMGLTKLDWNTTAFNTREPVTIGVSGKVGEVMAEMLESSGSPPPNYAFYM